MMEKRNVRRRFCSRALLTAAMVAMVFAGEAAAQSYMQTSRSFIQSPATLAMGDAGVALPAGQSVFFYNPAHLSDVAGSRPHLTLLGVRASLSSNLADQVAFFQDELQPAISDGIDEKSSAELRSLYDETLALGRSRTQVNGDVLLPSVVARVGGVGFGVGAFGHGTMNYRFRDAGAGLPLIDFSAVADLIFIGSAAVEADRIGANGLSVGLSAKVVERWLTLKNKAIDAIGSDESVNVFRGSAIGIDAGLLYDLHFLDIPGDVTLGAAAYDVVGGRFDYTYDSSISGDGEPDAALAAEEEALAERLYNVSPSYRIGAAYVLPRVLSAPFKNTALTLDYLWYSDPRVPQEALAHLHVGAQAQIGFAVLRGGLNSGYTTIGGGLDFGFVAIDYAYYGIEQGRFPGQLASWNHSVQVAFSL